MKRLCTICARGGSKGLPGKNTKILAGKPLVAHSIIQARESGVFDVIAVSSDSDEILATAEQWDVDFAIKRPLEMAADSASKHPAIQHCTHEVEDRVGYRFEIIVDVDVTSPLRTAHDIAGAVALQQRHGVTNVITGSPARKNPYFNIVETNAKGFVVLSKPPKERIYRRQDCPPCFEMNAAVYVWKRDEYMAAPEVFYPDTMLYEMPVERSHDVDTPLDFEFIEFVMFRRSPNRATD